MTLTVVQTNVLLCSAEEAKLRGKMKRGRPGRKRKAKKESEESSGEEPDTGEGKPGDDDNDINAKCD